MVPDPEVSASGQGLSNPAPLDGGSFLKAKFYLPGKDLLGRQGNYLTLVFFNFGIPKHGKLKSPAGSGAGYFIHILFVADELF
jgi:hypothetical protein